MVQQDIKNLKTEDYSQKYFCECKYIWKNYVPKSGQAECLQGELLREIEKLRWEAQSNGNINWDDDFAYFCDFIGSTLCEMEIFSDSEKEETAIIMSYIKECGEYSESFNRGEIPEDEADVNRLAYTEDNLYDRIADKIGYLHKTAQQPIPYERNEKIKR